MSLIFTGHCISARNISISRGRSADPDKDRSALADEGGNTFTLELSDEPPRHRGINKKKFHAFWDYDAVDALFPEVPRTLRKSELQVKIEPLKKQLVHEMATQEPTGWRMPLNVDINSYAEVWADEILRVAREAHEQLQFTTVHPETQEGRTVAAGEVLETAARPN